MSYQNNDKLIADIKRGDSKALEQFVKDNQLLVHAVVKRFSNARIGSEDLFQIGCVGLMKAIHNFDPSFEVKFSTYAVPIIIGEIKRFFRDDGSIRISRSLKEGYLHMLKVKEELTQKLDKEPTYAQIAKVMEIDVEDVILAFEANQFLYSLDETIYENDGSSIQLKDRIEDDKQNDIVMNLSLRKEFARLEQREQLLLHYRYDLNMKQEDIAKRLHVSQVQVSRLEKKIITKLRERLNVF